MTKYTMGLPGLPDKVVAEKLPGDITELEAGIATGPGMYGRVWLGQSLAFDEAYQILQSSRWSSSRGQTSRFAQTCCTNRHSGSGQPS